MINNGAAVVFHSASNNPGFIKRWNLDRAAVAIAIIPNELVVAREVIIVAASPVAIPQRQLIPSGPSLLTTSSR